jgi:glycerol-3-phosphate dehydrogenase
MADLCVTIIRKGTMLALNQRILHTVVNRCKMPSDGDILVPIHTVTVIGTTDVRVADPDRFAIEPWEVQLMLEEGEKLVPGFRSLRILRAWAGVRPLFQEPGGSARHQSRLRSARSPRAGRPGGVGEHHQRQMDHLPQNG